MSLAGSVGGRPSRTLCFGLQNSAVASDSRAHISMQSGGYSERPSINGRSPVVLGSGCTPARIGAMKQFLHVPSGYLAEGVDVIVTGKLVSGHRIPIYL